MIKNDTDKKHESQTGFHLTQKQIDNCTGTLGDNNPLKLSETLTERFIACGDFAEAYGKLSQL